MTSPTSSTRIILLTGASRGIGAAVARRLAREPDTHLVLAARNVAHLEAVDDAVQDAGGSATLVPVDLAQHERIDALGAAILEKFGRLDGFIGNAAILGKLSPLTHITPEQWQALLDVNVTANWRLLRILDPLLTRSQHPRVAFVTSGITQMTAPYWGGYRLTKAALESLCESYAAETTHGDMKVNLIDPGVVATDMRAQAFPSEAKHTLLSPDDACVTDLFVQAMSVDCKYHQARLFVSA